MTFVERLLAQRKLILTLVALFGLLGVASWRTMVRQEDPRLPDQFGLVQTSFPGADAESVERLVLEPIEDQLAQVDEITSIESTAHAELALVDIDLREGLSDTDAAWDRVREALTKARREFPEGVGEPVLDDRLIDTDSVVYALTGDPDPLRLAAAAEALEDELLTVPGVATVELLADPGEQITITFDDSAARRHGLTPGMLAAQLAARTRILPGGSLHVAGQTVRLRPQSDFGSVEEIASTPVRLPSGDTVPLASVARARRGPEEPLRFRARHNGEAMVGLGVVPRRDLNLVDFGRRIRERVAAFAPRLAPIEVHEVAFQADRVASRLRDLARSLLLGAAIVAGVLILFMGPRLGLVVTAVVPLVTLTSLAIFNLAGGVLHQISIAALVISLGMLVDNGIVVTEAIQWGLDRGLGPSEAARRAVKELATPLAAATATTLAAFVPMLLSRSTTGDFTRTLPVVIMLTLTVSYLFAMVVTPILGQVFLAGRPGRSESGFDRLATWVGRVAVTRPLVVLTAAALAVGLSLAAAPWVRREFFPKSDRNQLLVEVRLPDGSHLEATDAVALRLERALAERPEVTSVTTFVGRSAPRFYYNVNQVPWSPHFGHLLVETTSTRTVDAVVRWARDHARHQIPEAEIVVRTLEQGPPVDAPIELQLYGEGFEELGQAVELVMRELRATPGAVDVRHGLGTGAPTLRFRIDDAAAGRHGLSRDDVAVALFGHTRGLAVGQYRAGQDPVPVVLRSSLGEELPVADLPAVDVAGAGAEPVPLAQVARIDVEWRPATIDHRNRRRLASVYSQLEEGYTYSDVLRAAGPRLASLELPAGVELRVGGAAQESEAANAAIVRMVPIGVILLLGILMAEFRSFRRLGIVLVTVPLAAAGVVPGLLVSGQPFGFMSMLGVVALVGVVVNNAIVLLEVVEAGRGGGDDVPTALRRAIERRLRPILLTTATTVSGLLPLALSSSSLWPPMAWAMISGLTASTLLTLLVVPALYLMLFSPGSLWRAPRPAATRAVGNAGLLLLTLLAAAPGRAQEAGAAARMTLAEAMRHAAARPRVEAAESRAAAARLGARAEHRAGRWPSLVADASLTERDRTLDLATPIGSFPFQPARAEEGALQLVQPLLAPARQLYAAPAARAEAEGAALAAERARESAGAEAAEAFLDVLAIDAALAATEASIESLRTSLAESEARVREGRSLATEALKVDLALAVAEQDRLALRERRGVAARELGRAAGVGGPVEPVWNGGDYEAAEPSLATALEEAAGRRADLRALRARIEALDLRRKSVLAERWPSLEAAATWIYSTGSPFEQQAWLEGGVRLRWTAFVGGTRAPRAAAVRAEREALEAEYQEASRAVEVEVAAALARLATARGALALGERGVERASETLRVERERHRAGRVTINDLLEAEAALRAETTRRDVARLEIVRAAVRLELALGLDPSAVRIEESL